MTADMNAAYVDQKPHISEADNELDRLLLDYESSVKSNQKQEALTYINNAVRLLLMCDDGVGGQANEIVKQILSLENTISEPDSWQQAQELFVGLRKLSFEANQARKLYQSTHRCIRLSRQLSLEGIVKSSIALRRFEEAYEVAATLVQEFPEDESTRHLFEEFRKRYAEYLMELSEGQLERIRELLEVGEPEIALRYLEDFRHDFTKKGGISYLTRDMVRYSEKFLWEAERQIEIYRIAERLLEEVRQEYNKRDYQKARALLEETRAISDRFRFTRLESEIHRLYEAVTETIFRGFINEARGFISEARNNYRLGNYREAITALENALYTAWQSERGDLDREIDELYKVVISTQIGHDALKVKHYEEALASLSRVRDVDVLESAQFQSLLEEAVKGYADERLQEAQIAISQLKLKKGQDILTQTVERIEVVIGNTQVDILAQVKSLLQEVTEFREALRDLYEAKAYLEKGDSPSEQTDKLLQGVLSLPYHSVVADRLKVQARLLIAGVKLQQGDYEGYQWRLEELLAEDPLNKEFLFRLEWVKGKRRRAKREARSTENYQRRIEELNKQAEVWFWGSIVTAIFLLGISVYVILVTVNRDNPLSSLASLVSIIPVLATKLVYDQSTKAHERADQIYKESEFEREREIEVERDEFNTLKKRIFGEETSADTAMADILPLPEIERVVA